MGLTKRELIEVYQQRTYVMRAADRIRARQLKAMDRRNQAPDLAYIQMVSLAFQAKGYGDEYPLGELIEVEE